MVIDAQLYGLSVARLTLIYLPAQHTIHNITTLEPNIQQRKSTEKCSTTEKAAALLALSSAIVSS